MPRHRVVPRSASSTRITRGAKRRRRDGETGAERREQCTNRVGVARPTGHHGDPGFARQAPPSIRHVNGRRLMPHTYVLGRIELLQERAQLAGRDAEYAPSSKGMGQLGTDVRSWMHSGGLYAILRR